MPILGVESHDFAKNLVKMQEFCSPKHFCRILKCPKFETRFLAHASGIEARAIHVLGVHRAAFAQHQLRSRDVAVERRPVQRRGASGACPRKPVGHCGLPAVRWRGGRCAADDERKCGPLSSTSVQPTKER